MHGMKMMGWAAAAILAGSFVPLVAQGPPIIPSHPKPAATLLVLCDLPCNWRLDGVPQGHIDADGSAKAKVELGEHLVLAVTDDGLDQIKKMVEVRSSGQTVADIALKPIREARLKTDTPKPVDQLSPTLLVSCDMACTWSLDGEVKGSIDAEGSTKVKVDAGQHKVIGVSADGLDRFTTTADARAGAQTLVAITLQPIHDARVKRTQVHTQDSSAVSSGLVWIDSGTQLEWVTRDNERNVTWRQAADYCGALQTAGHGDWRLGTIDELHSIYDPSASVAGIGETGSAVTQHVKGNIRLTGWEWSQSQADIAGQAWGISLISGKRLAGRVGDTIGNRALCVRRAEN